MLSRGVSTCLRRSSRLLNAVTPFTENLPSCIAWGNAWESQQEAVPCSRQMHSQLLSNECGLDSRALSQEGHTVPNSVFNQRHLSTSTAAAAAVRKRSAPQPSRKALSSTPKDAIEPMSASGSELASPADPWTEVVHKESGQIYYWNQQTDETTAIGEPRPGQQGRVQYPSRTINQGTSLLGLVGVGAGIGLVFAILGRLL